MPYSKTNWVNGDIITAEKLNKIELGIENAKGTFIVDYEVPEAVEWRSFDIGSMTPPIHGLNFYVMDGLPYYDAPDTIMYFGSVEYPLSELALSEKVFAYNIIMENNVPIKEDDTKPAYLIGFATDDSEPYISIVSSEDLSNSTVHILTTVDIEGGGDIILTPKVSLSEIEAALEDDKIVYARIILSQFGTICVPLVTYIPNIEGHPSAMYAYSLYGTEIEILHGWDKGAEAVTLSQSENSGSSGGDILIVNYSIAGEPEEGSIEIPFTSSYSFATILDALNHNKIVIAKIIIHSDDDVYLYVPLSLVIDDDHILYEAHNDVFSGKLHHTIDSSSGNEVIVAIPDTEDELDYDAIAQAVIPLLPKYEGGVSAGD